MKFLSSDVAKGIKVLLTTSDHGDDFIIKPDPRRYNDLSRNRVIAEHELDGVYVLGKDFETEWRVTELGDLVGYSKAIRTSGRTNGLVSPQLTVRYGNPRMGSIEEGSCGL